MGLDMYLRAKLADNTPTIEIGDWRKHANLHGYMEHLYRERGGTEESFNCIPLELTKEDCEKVIEMSENNSFETAEGFFWGESYPEHNEETISYMKKALEYIKEGKKIYYDSWW